MCGNAHARVRNVLGCGSNGVYGRGLSTSRIDVLTVDAQRVLGNEWRCVVGMGDDWLWTRRMEVRAGRNRWISSRSAHGVALRRL